MSTIAPLEEGAVVVVAVVVVLVVVAAVAAAVGVVAEGVVAEGVVPAEQPASARSAAPTIAVVVALGL
jgi:hypothetical protein